MIWKKTEFVAIFHWKVQNVSFVRMPSFYEAVLELSRVSPEFKGEFKGNSREKAEGEKASAHGEG